MTVLERALAFVAARVVPGSTDTRSEIVQTAADVSAGASVRSQVGEVASLAALGLRLQARLATDDDPREIVRQASVVGASLALLGAAAWAGAVVQSHTWGSMLSIAAIVVAALVQRSRLRVAICIGVAVGWPVLVGTDGRVVLAAVAIAGISAALAGETRCPPPKWPTWVVLVGLMASHGVAQVTSIQPLTPMTIVGLAAAGPVLLLVLGWFDPRYAVAGTVVWLWRLLATDAGELASGATQLITSLTVDEVVVRCVIMASGVIFGAVVSRQAVVRSALI